MILSRSPSRLASPEPEPMSARSSELVPRQDMVLTRRQALEHITHDALRHRLATSWQILLPGVYLTTTGIPTERQRLRAALLYGGADAQLADLTALREYGVRYLPADPTIYLLLPAEVRRVNRDGVVVRRTHRLPQPVVFRGFPYVPLSRALVEFAARIGDRRTANAVLADAVQRNLVRTEQLGAEAPHVTGRGASVVRDVVGWITVGARSAPEIDYLEICAESRVLPRPLVNPLLRLPGGRRVSPDALFEGAGLVHETNGRAPHADEDPFEDMQARHDAMTTAGLTVLHDSPRQLWRERQRVRAQSEQCYQRLAGRGLPPGVSMLRRGPSNGPSVGL